MSVYHELPRTAKRLYDCMALLIFICERVNAVGRGIDPSKNSCTCSISLVPNNPSPCRNYSATPLSIYSDFPTEGSSKNCDSKPFAISATVILTLV